MNEIKIFKLTNGLAKQLVTTPVKKEKLLQTLVEKNLETLLNVRLVASEHSTGKKHGGRIDTLGLDENYCPTIIEYKRTLKENVINQGLYYLDWLMDHKADMELLVQKNLDDKLARQLDWSSPRLLCIAEDYTRYDIHAIQQIKRNIELLKYKYYSSDLLMIEMVNVVSAQTERKDDLTVQNNIRKSEDGKIFPLLVTTREDHLANASIFLVKLYDEVRNFMTNEIEDIRELFLKRYIAYRRLKNVATLKLLTQKDTIQMWLPVNPDSVELEKGYSRDVRNVGHYGTGNLELRIKNVDDFEKSKPLILRSAVEN